MIFSTYLVEQQGRVSVSEWPHCCSRACYYFSMDRLFFSGMILSGREIILNAGGDRNSPEDRCVLMTTATELSWRCTGKKSDNFRGVSNTIRSGNTAETYTMPQVWVLDKCPNIFEYSETERGRRYKLLLWCIAFLLNNSTVSLFFLILGSCGKENEVPVGPSVAMIYRGICTSSRKLLSKIIFYITFRWFLRWCSRT